MTGKEYVSLAMRTNDGKCDSRLWSFSSQAHRFGDLINGVLGLVGETGEFTDMIKKWVFHRHKLDQEHLKKELGDIMWYIAMICHAFEFDLDEIMQMNIDKLKARYPDGFSEERSQHRQEGDV